QTQPGRIQPIDSSHLDFRKTSMHTYALQAAMQSACMNMTRTRGMQWDIGHQPWRPCRQPCCPDASRPGARTPARARFLPSPTRAPRA
ncbi:hypothetical protein, partial [Bordetella pertussis]|uniref:hypothetical protein n=1 Tax=Bordetella pertussis TaxID=520 RepID=UPI001C9E54CE